MNVGDLLVDGYERILGVVHRALDGLDSEQLTMRPYPDGNSIAWLIWHLTRVQDDHVADVAGTEQLWTADGWADRFGLPFDEQATGFGHSRHEVAQVRAPAELLLGYHEAVHAHTVAYLRTLTADDLDRIVDESWDPPVTLGVRLVSVLADDLQHAGQAAYLRGMALAR